MLVAGLLPVAPSGASPQDRQQQVLVVYSTRRDAQIALTGERELPRILEDGLGKRLDYYAEFIDPARFADPAYQDALSTFIRKKYEDHRFDLIVTMGGDATAFVAAHRDVFAGAPPVAFYGTSRPMPRPANSTGVIAELQLKPTVTLAAALDPALQHVYVVSGADVGDRAMAALARQQLTGLAPGLDVTYLVALAATDVDDRLRRLPPHSMVFYLIVDKDATGAFFHPLRFLERVVAVANAPTYSWVDSTMGSGVVGGSLKRQAAQIASVGQLALRVLRGESAADIPIMFRDFNRYEVDWRQLRRWGLSESRLPEGTVISFRDPSLWDRYRSYIVTALVLLFAQSALIAGLLVQRRRRRRAEEDLLANQLELRASYDRIRDLGGRLLKAQETERSHIARELHDDVSQQLALIEMDLKMLGTGARADADVATEAVGRVHAVVRSVRDLSHRLHPAKLRLIGLSVALKGLQKEMSQGTTEVLFTEEGVPTTLPPDVTLSLFRVAQEALQNARKYSGARQVTIRLTGDATGLFLTIQDDGAGFDVNAAWGAGLGLVSMMERIEAVGGRLAIHSEPGAGTRIEASIPLAAAVNGSIAV